MNLAGPVGPGLLTNKFQGGSHDAMIALFLRNLCV